MIRLAILGVGSVRCSPAVLASLATYFGERPLEIRLFDADEERLDLFDRYARLLAHLTESTHHLLFRPDLDEALQGADCVILQIGANCARKMLGRKGHEDVRASALDSVRGRIADGAEVLSLQLPEHHPDWPGIKRLDWLPQISEAERRAWPHQILRWIRGEEHPYDVLKQNERSPVKSWLDDLHSPSRL